MKATGSIISALAVSAGVVLLIGLTLWGNSEDPIPGYFMFVFIAVLAAIVCGVAAALIMRIKEINGGEEDEARKY